MTEQPSVDVEPSDEAAAEPSADARGGRPSEAHTPLSITRQYIKDFSFENPNAPAIYSAFRDDGPELNVSVDIAANPLDDNAHEVVLSLAVKATYKDTTAFIIELQYAAQAKTEPDTDPEKVERALMIEVPRYLFPFVRNIIVNATREGGFPPLLLNPINFAKLHRNRLAE